MHDTLTDSFKGLNGNAILSIYYKFCLHSNQCISQTILETWTKYYRLKFYYIYLKNRNNLNENLAVFNSPLQAYLIPFDVNNYSFQRLKVF